MTLRTCVHGNYFVLCFENPAVVLTYTANATLDWSDNLRTGVTRDYSEKPSSMVRTRCEEEHQAFLATHSDCLQGMFTFPHSLSVNRSSGRTPGETIRVITLYCSTRYPVHHRLCLRCFEYRSCVLLAVILGRI